MSTIATEQAYLTEFNQIRNLTLHLCKPLYTEDYVVQPIVDVSPPKWHLGHTTWFFEQFILKNYMPGYQEFHPDFNFVFNSYYESVGKRVLRAERGNLTRPSVTEVKAYRSYVDEEMNKFLSAYDNTVETINNLILLGFSHEQQHQELLMTDVKFILGHNPLFPVYSDKTIENGSDYKNKDLKFLKVGGGKFSIGYEGEGFHFDNEKGVHQVYLHPFEIGNRLITNKEYLEFINDGGYNKFELWLQEGFQFINEDKLKAPLYWHFIEGEWFHFTLHGFEKVNPAEPVTHVSFYEADAFAKWQGMRLPTEFEWETAAKIYSPVISLDSIFLEKESFAPERQQSDNDYQLFGNAWEWTNSSYLAYPFYARDEGAVGEYNGKFMINQMVLRGGSCVTPANHIRHTYRNFFHSDKRWQFSGIRLARYI